MVDKKIDVNVEILCQIDNGEATIGQKRNDLLSNAKGEYLCFIDDDDRISSNYISLVLEAIQKNPDCCSLNGLIITNGINPKNFIHSIKYNSWYEENNIYYRPPNHLNCIKSQIAKQFKFPCISNGEDRDWSMQIASSGLLKTESEINETIYYYDYISNK
jgi:glycosyltransferase involved in cell wall biosynthesis